MILKIFVHVSRFREKSGISSDITKARSETNQSGEYEYLVGKKDDVTKHFP